MIDPSKYNKPVPRYTSYPTIPAWDSEAFSKKAFEKSLQTAFWESSKEVSVYIHLPFCESLCTYCACNTRITKNHKVEEPYIEAVLKEWSLYLERLPDIPIIREIHLGGGTPTFFSPDKLNILLDGIFKGACISSNANMSFEGHPANTTQEHLLTLNSLGFDRLSLGIQDFDLNVQKHIHRLQSYKQVERITDEARAIGYSSVNYDMVYGLPGQTVDTLTTSLERVSELAPDRIAFYSYAHVPSIRPAQRHYEQYLPSIKEKRAFMIKGRQAFLKQGYVEVGMDHFVKPKDELMKAQQEGYLHRNFMGYTPFTSRLQIGLGMSAIGDSWTGFAQNHKSLEDYYQSISNNTLPIHRGHNHTDQDIFLRTQILNLMCRFETTWSEDQILKHGFSINFDLLEELKSDGLIESIENGLRVKDEGRPFIRNICSAFDASLIGSHSFKFSTN